MTAAVTTVGPLGVKFSEQILIEIEGFSKEGIHRINISNCIKCDMSEYRRAIKFLEGLKRTHRITFEVFRFIMILRKDLLQIEKWREANDGKPYTPNTFKLDLNINV